MQFNRIQFFSLFLLSMSFAICSGQADDITIIEDQGRGVVNLSARNTGTSHYKVMLDVESNGLDFSSPVPYEAIVPAGKTVHLLTLTPKPGIAWRYRYSTSYAEYDGPLPDPVTLPPPPPVKESNPQPVPVKENNWEPVVKENDPVTPVDDPPGVTPGESNTEMPPQQPAATPSTDTEGQHVIYDPERPGEVKVVPESKALEEESPTVPSATATTKPAAIPVPSNIDPDPGITLYVQPDCNECTKATQYLDGLNVKYRLVDLSTGSREAHAMWTQLMEQGVGGVVSPPVIAKGSDMYFEVEDVTVLLSRLVVK